MRVLGQRLAVAEEVDEAGERARLDVRVSAPRRREDGLVVSIAYEIVSAGALRRDGAGEGRLGEQRVVPERPRSREHFVRQRERLAEFAGVDQRSSGGETLVELRHALRGLRVVGWADRRAQVLRIRARVDTLQSLRALHRIL